MHFCFSHSDPETYTKWSWVKFESRMSHVPFSLSCICCYHMLLCPYTLYSVYVCMYPGQTTVPGLQETHRPGGDPESPRPGDKAVSSSWSPQERDPPPFVQRGSHVAPWSHQTATTFPLAHPHRQHQHWKIKNVHIAQLNRVRNIHAPIYIMNTLHTNKA